MKRKDFWKGFGVALALIVVLNLAWKPICRAIPWHVLPFEISMSKDAKVDMIQSYLDKYYVEDIDQGKLEDTLFAGMLAGVGDKYTYYMPKENLRQYLTNTNGNFDGVGIEIYTTQDGEVVISSVMPGQLAETAGGRRDYRRGWRGYEGKAAFGCCGKDSRREGHCGYDSGAARR